MKGDWKSKPNARFLVRCGRFGPDVENKWLANRALKPFSCLAANRRVGLAVDLEPDENYARGRMLTAADAFR